MQIGPLANARRAQPPSVLISLDSPAIYPFRLQRPKTKSSLLVSRSRWYNPPSFSGILVMGLVRRSNRCQLLSRSHT